MAKYPHMKTGSQDLWPLTRDIQCDGGSNGGWEEAEQLAYTGEKDKETCNYCELTKIYL